MSANVSILGNTGSEVKLRYSENGTPIASFPLASNSFKKGPEGRVQVTHWFNIVAFGKTAESLAEHVTVGTHLLIHGRLSFSPWTTDKGEPRSGAEVSVFSFEFVGSNRTGDQNGAFSDGNGTENNVPEYTGPATTESSVDEQFANQF